MNITLRIFAFVLAALVLVTFQPVPARATPAPTFSKTAEDATATLLDVLYAGGGMWRSCNQSTCKTTNSDWGADSATYTLYLRWSITHDTRIRTVLSELLDTAPHYPEPCANAPCPAWSDTPSWDAVTLMRENEALGNDSRALDLAKTALRYVEQSRAFASGACPEIPFQNTETHIKTLETDANVIKASLLLYDATQQRQYLDDAISRYANARKYYFDASASMYTVHVIDDGTTCVQQPRRFFASVNGDMIWNGLHLWRLTGERTYYDEAVATAAAVDENLSDHRGVFANLQGENDVVEPLVEAMYDLALNEHVDFARHWILRNASAALAARGADGTFSRYFDGPAQASTSIWESNGGLALQIAAGVLDPTASVPDYDAWDGSMQVGDAITKLPATIVFQGTGIALVGTISELCQKHHVRVFIDGQETFDRTGLWQNPSMPDGDSVLFAWRWNTPGTHTIRLEPSDPSLAGQDVMHVQGYILPANVPANVEAGAGDGQR
jgi:hypothetical protein